MGAYCRRIDQPLEEELVAKKTFVDLDTTSGDAVIVVVAHITHMLALSPHESTIFLAGGKTISVKGTLNDLVNKIWPAGAEA